MSGIPGKGRARSRSAIRHGWFGLPLAAVFALIGIPCFAQAPATDAAASRARPSDAAPNDAPSALPPSAPVPALDALARARKYVEDYFAKFSDLICRESVTQLVLNGSGHTIYRENSTFDYQFQATGQGGTLKFNETREPRTPAFRDPARTLLVTTGFASLLLVLHPMYEASYTFDSAGEETIGGATYARIHFTPLPGATSPATLRLRGRNYPLPMSGTIWLEPQSGAVVKIEALVDSSLSDMGLAGLRSQVNYAIHDFQNPKESVWIADSAVIDVETPRQHWRNLHRFTDYKRFDVNVHEEIGQNQ